MKISLLEYVLHPFNTFQGIYGYKQSTRHIGDKQHTDKKQAFNRNTFLDQYFEQMNDNNRINLYAVYNEIGQDALMTAVLDTYARACTQPNVEAGRDIAGKVVWGYAPNKSIQAIVNAFLDHVEIHESSFEILRAMYQYGDQIEMLPGMRNEGILRLDPCDPWQIGVIVDEYRQVKGFGPANEFGEVTSSTTVLPYYEAAHFRMPRRRRTDIYGARSSLFFGIREYWQDLQWVMDKIVLERMWRRPDRTLIALDIGGMSTEDAFDACEEWRNRMYRDFYFNPGAGEMKSMPAAWSESRDIILPTGADNKTSFSNAPSTTSSGSLDDLNFLLRRVFGGLRFPPGFLNLELGGTYDSRTSLEKQDLGFAQNCMGPQQSFLRTLTQMVMVHLAYLNIDPRLKKNQFSLMMNPISTFQELERKELLSMRFDFMDNALRIGQDRGWNMQFWTKYVMMQYAQFPEDMVDTLLKKVETPQDKGVEDSGGGDTSSNLFASMEQTDEYKRLMEALNDNPKAAEALVFAAEGGSMFASNMVKFPVGALQESSSAEVRQGVLTDTASFEKRLEDRKVAKRAVWKMFFEKGVVKHGATV